MTTVFDKSPQGSHRATDPFPAIVARGYRGKTWRADMIVREAVDETSAAGTPAVGRPKETDMQKADIGLIGLAVMGENLVLNMASHGFRVAVYNRTTAKVDEFVNGRGAGKSIIGTRSVEELCASLERPRRVMIMVKAGAVVDRVIESLLPYLEPGDIVIDGGNSQFQDSSRRTEELPRGLAARQADFPGHRGQNR
jgi:hypothetical protein